MITFDKSFEIGAYDEPAFRGVVLRRSRVTFQEIAEDALRHADNTNAARSMIIGG